MRKQHGFSLLELAIAAPLLLLAIGVTSMMIGSSAEASHVHRIRARALQTAAGTVDRLALELSQSTSETDGTRAKYWIETDGIRFKRVVGVGTTGGDLGQQLWSDDIVFHWDRKRQVVSRKVGDGDEKIIAREITNFSCAPNAEGQMICMIECSKKTRDGKVFKIARTFRATPLNKLE